MKPYLSLLLTGALILGATLVSSGAAFGETRKSENSANHASSNHRSRSSTHHRSSGSHHSNSTNSGSKTHSNIPSN
jgi:hypothetical protein